MSTGLEKGWVGSSGKRLNGYHQSGFFLSICPPQELVPVLGPLERYMQGFLKLQSRNSRKF